MKNAVIWSPGVTMANIEKQVIYKALDFYKTREVTANALKISLKIFDKKMEIYEQEELEYKNKLEETQRKREAHVRRVRGLDP